MNQPKQTLAKALVLAALLLVAVAGCSPRENICFNCRGDSYVRAGGDIRFYSDEMSTETIRLDGAAGGGLTLYNGDLGMTSGDATLTAGNLTLTLGDLTMTSGDLTMADGDLTVADDLTFAAQTSITVTNGAAFTVTGSYQPISAAGEVTPTITAGATAGDLVVLVNTSAQTINLADSGTLMLTAAAALGQYDTLTLMSDGTNWLELSRADN